MPNPSVRDPRDDLPATQQEIADAMGLSFATVRMKEARTIRRLWRDKKLRAAVLGCAGEA